MKLKYYLRGLGVGIFTATVLLMIVFSMTKSEPTDEEIMERAAKLGMIMPEDGAQADGTEADTQTAAEATETLESLLGTERVETAEIVAQPADDTEENTQTADTQTADGQQTTDAQTTDAQTTTDGQTTDAQQTADAQTTTDGQTADGQQTADAQTADSQPAEDTRERYTLVINSGDVCRIICNRLAEAGVVDDAQALRAYLAEKGYATSIIAGTYSVPYGAGYEEIYNILRQGPAE